MRPHRLLILPLTMLLALVGASGGTAGLNPEPRAWASPEPAPESRGENYRAGQRALDAEHWSEAAQSFAEAASEGGPDADGALYWHAYALLKMNRSARAMAALEELKSSYPESSWVDDAVALQHEAGQPDAGADSSIGEDDEIKLLALNSLIHVDWERARPILEKYLSDGSSPQMLERALFVVSQSDAPEARQMLIDAASDPTNPELASQAVQYLGFFEDEESAAQLKAIYASNSSLEVKRSVLEAMMIADDTAGLAELARSETEPELRRTAVELLGVLDAVDELKDLYAQESSTEVKHSILEAFMIADDTQTLVAMAQGESDEELRGNAIELLGVLDATTELRELYRTESSSELRRRIADAFMIADDAEALIEIAKTDADPEVRRAAIEGLALVESPAAKQALSDIYSSASEVEVKLWVIDGFMLQDDSAKLIEIARAESSPELRRAAIEALSLVDDESAEEFLLELLEEG